MPRRRRVTSSSPGPSGAVGQRLRRLSEWAVASCITASVGCGTEPPGKLTAQLTAAAPVHLMPCADLLLVTVPVATPNELDYIGVFSPFFQTTYRSLLSDYGEPCKTAKDRDECLSAIERAIDSRPTDCGPGVAQCSMFIVTSLGDKVLRHDTAESLREVLGDVNTAAEAVLFAQLHGLYVACAAESTGVANAGTLVQATDTGWRVQSRWSGCNPSFGDQVIEIRNDGTSAGFERNLVAGRCVSTARRTAGLHLGAADEMQGPVAAFLALSAQLEAASVPAFNRLARELLRLGSPQLAAAARRSARDEAYHATLMQRLAARYGARPSRPHVAPARCSRTAYEIAHENAVEGCVRESFGAFTAWQQSFLSTDPLVARTMRRIAADETRHAELSWRVAGWLEPQLMATELRQLARARAQAVKQLQQEIALDFLPETAQALLGWPSQAQRHALLQRFATELDLS
jgi:hypothetical protein